ncbi:MAG: sucrase ferredoxin [Pseudomonadota bacterium]
MNDAQRPAGPVECATLDPQAPMWGTAEQVDLWLLLEAPGTWPAQALGAEGPLAPAARQWLESQLAALSAMGLKVRAQLIKQPRAASDQRRSLLLGYGGRLLAHDGTAGLPQPPLKSLLTAMDGGEDTAPGWRVLRRPRYFVCTNGRRDLCCARYGMPVYAALRERFGDRAWQTSHVGGHRFAANVLTLPRGALYGRLQLDTLEPFVTQVERGEVAFEWLRGRSAYRPLVQAAEALLGQQRARLLHVDGDDRQATVRFATPSGVREVSLRRSLKPQWILAGCDKPARKETYPYESLG